MSQSASEVWQILERHFTTELSQTTLRELIASDPSRFSQFSFEVGPLFFDFSKQKMSPETPGLLAQWCVSQDLQASIDALFSGKKVNTTEQRPALHTLLRSSRDEGVELEGKALHPEVMHELQRVEHFVNRLYSGACRGSHGDVFTDVVNIGIGGSHLGPELLVEALAPYQQRIRAHFLSNLDAFALKDMLRKLNPRKTLVVISSKSFTTKETLVLADRVCQWMSEALGEDGSWRAQHLCAVTSARDKAKAFGVHENRIYSMWDWVGGRYSVWSAVSLAAIMALGVKTFIEFLRGAELMDNHFRHAPFEANAPVLAAALSCCYETFYGTSTHAVLPYCDRMSGLISYLQQAEMESNGKSVTRDGEPVSGSTAPVVWGGVGSDCQHAFMQMMHQGTQWIPADFIATVHADENTDDTLHSMLLANCLAQSAVYASGKTFDESCAELREKGLSDAEVARLAPHRVLAGNKPSTIILLDRLSPGALGALLSFYEHKIFVQGMLWNINPFDQWGVEMGKELAAKTEKQLLGEVSESLDASTRSLLRWVQHRAKQ